MAVCRPVLRPTRHSQRFQDPFSSQGKSLSSIEPLREGPEMLRNVQIKPRFGEWRGVNCSAWRLRRYLLFHSSLTSSRERRGWQWQRTNPFFSLFSLSSARVRLIAGQSEWTMEVSECRLVHAWSQVLGIFLPTSCGGAVKSCTQSRLGMIEA